MKNKNLWSIISFALLVNLFVLGCSNDSSKSDSTISEDKNIPVTGFTLSVDSITIGIGDEIAINTTITPTNATDKTIIWKSQNTSIATITDGVLKGISIGTTTITATCGNIEKTVSVTVKESVIPVSSISLSASELFLNVNQSVTVVATVLPENATEKVVSWKSSNPSVATVENGIITTKSFGSATITATAGTQSATVNVTVCVPVESVSVSPSSVTMNIGETTTVSATVLPTNATEKTVIWTSSNESAATVNSNGRITAISGGTTTITATCGGLSNSVDVTVLVPVTSISLSETNISIAKDGIYKLKATIEPLNSTEKTITWTSSNISVAIVSDGFITAVSPGSATITASCGGKSKSANVTVTANSGTIEVTSLMLSETSITLGVDDVYSIIATPNPTNADDKTITWTSSNPSVATVNYGIISAESTGTTNITATCGSVSKNVSVTVCNANIPVSNISISPNTYSITVGNTKQILYTVLPSLATNKTLSWTTSDSSIATVSSSGVVTAKKAGTVTITATAASGVKAETLIFVSNEGFSATIPENIVYDRNELLQVTYRKIGNIYRFKAVAPRECSYIDFYVNGMVNQNIFYDCTEATLDIDITQYDTRFLNVYVFGMALNEDNLWQIIGSEEQISIDLQGE